VTITQPGVYQISADEETLRFPIAQGRHSVLVDRADLDLIGAHAWMVLHGHNGKLYAYRISRRVKAIYMHRLIAGTPAGFETDHANGDGLDNRRSNLRTASASQNRANIWKPARPDGTAHTSIYKGVSWDRSRLKWQAKITVAGRCRSLGRFSTEVAAALAYDSAAINAWGEFARVNFPRAEQQ